MFNDSELESTDIFHLHHLTPQHAAVAQLWPDKPIIGHLHGTELKMIEHIIERREVSELLGCDLAGMAAFIVANADLSISQLSQAQRQTFLTTNWEQWRFGDFWEAQLKSYAQECSRIVVISPQDRDLAGDLLNIDVDSLEWVPNGVDTRVFDRQYLTDSQKIRLLRHWLVDDPQGWDESGDIGSISYRLNDLDAFIDPDSGQLHPVLLYVGRFLDFKRLPLLIRAYQQARPHFTTSAPLIIWGGSPGEWEGVHPHTAIRNDGAEGIFFTGWRGHDDLPLGLNCADIMVAPSHNEPFGQVYLEAMASGLPVIASQSGGPLTFVNTQREAPNGWLFPPDDLDALTTTLIDAVNNPKDRRTRSENAYEQIRREYSWTTISKRFESVYQRELAAGT